MLKEQKLERVIGVIYRPQSERASHYFQVVLPDQFDEYVWFDKSKAVIPLDSRMLQVCRTPICSAFKQPQISRVPAPQCKHHAICH